MNDSIADQVYIDSIKNGDVTAYSFLVNRYKDMAFTISLKLTGNREEAEDAVQESFIKAYEAIHTFKGTAKFSTWLFTIVYRTSLRISKDRKIIPLAIKDIHDNYNADLKTPQLEQLQSDEQSKYIVRAINELSKTEALLITLYYLNESSIKEISEITGLSTANIKVQLFRARKKLERKLSFLL